MRYGFVDVPRLYTIENGNVPVEQHALLPEHEYQGFKLFGFGDVIHGVR